MKDTTSHCMMPGLAKVKCSGGEFGDAIIEHVTEAPRIRKTLDDPDSELVGLRTNMAALTLQSDQ